MTRDAHRKAQREANAHWKRFQAVREMLGLDIRQIEIETGIPDSTIGNWEAGHTPELLGDVLNLARYYAHRVRQGMAIDGVTVPRDQLSLFTWLLVGDGTWIERIKGHMPESVELPQLDMFSAG